MLPHGLQYTRLPCPLHLLKFAETHVYWVGDAIQTSHPLWLLLLLPSIFPNIRVFSNESDLRIRWPTYWSSASASLLPMTIQGWFPLVLNGLISLLFKELSRVFSSTTVQRHQFKKKKKFKKKKNTKASILQCTVVKNYDFITHNNFLTYIIKKSILSIVWYIWICIHIYQIHI